MVGIKDFDLPSCCNSCGHWSFNRDDEPLCDLTYEYIRQFDKRQDDCPLVEAIPKDQYEQRLKENNELINDLEELRTMINKFAESYENRLKADMVAMLEEIDLEMSEQSFGIQTEPWEAVEKLRKEIIQQKINALKENADVL